ncbi:DUF7716 domain-containing protein [Rubellicoccus peritrichatus]|uniref:DUF7716 domain-containing protein n=1 Tax=Rubellicoccus peritrichatus TaxID=3080537 RepID=A0AAQ3L8Y1_9BACT|nr:hypothetical protein [Puniceicoccus sp. CR14]WOO39877.1 hypothetical protein RZN69_14725 [Puniceicoccus sp. CR14]
MPGPDSIPQDWTTHDTRSKPQKRWHHQFQLEKAQKGGKTDSYKIQRRIEGAENWDIADLSITTNATLKKQPYDIEPDEYVEIEELYLASGYSNYLNSDQVADVVTNLKSQKNHYSEEERVKAFEYYSSEGTSITM